MLAAIRTPRLHCLCPADLSAIQVTNEFSDMFCALMA